MHRRIHAFGDTECGLGATADEVAEAEASLRVRFSESYQDFLRRFGWARFSHEQLYGLGKDVPVHLELRRNTLAERNQMEPALPHLLVPVMNDGAGNHYCLDTRRMVGGECPVVLWNHELGRHQEPDPIAPSFDLWLTDLLDNLKGNP